MNRLAHLAIALAITISPLVVDAQQSTVGEIEQLIQQKESEYNNYNTNLQSQISLASDLEQELEELRSRGVLIEADRVLALNEMNRQYEAMIENPDLDITQAQGAYQKSVRDHKVNKDSITDKYNGWQAQIQKVEQVRLDKHALLNTIESLKERLNSARIERLYNEFNRRDSANVSHNIACDRDETIASCIERGKSLAKQKASKRFLDQLYEGLSESTLVTQNRTNADGYVQVLRSDTEDSNFSGLGNFSITLAVDLQGNLKRREACSMLGLDARYCRESEPLVQITPVSEETPIQTDESVMYELTVRSNVYDDEVFIDGVSYGSTRLQVMLPSGEHEVEVIKRGFEPYSNKVNLDQSQSLRVELDRAQFAFSKGEKIQDILTGDIPGPNLVVVTPGNFKMGDITGLGLDNERPVESKQIIESYGIGEVEVTVGDYQRFVDATSYVTSAEKSKGCAFYENGSPVWNEQSSWKSPGYTQTDKHPVVCLSLEDAQAYVDWLSANSTQSYRIPSEVEWEYAARSGTEADYWWGEGVGTDKANCGWCGSRWSNQSAAPVASFARNDFGVYDTVGNVWEWTLSDKAQNGAVVRGGAWNFAPRLARVSTRMEISPDFRSNYIGFRVVRDR
jgi:formylglycine-generating enzyme required for sulfatase activity